MTLSLRAEVEELPLKAPFHISGYSFDTLPVVVAAVERDGVVGRGEAAGVYYLDDTAEAAAAQLNTLAIDEGLTRESLRERLPPGGARNALDCALWDLEAQEQGRPAWVLAGLAGLQPCVTALTIGADTPERMAAGARKFQDAQALKLKLTGETEQDIARVRAVRAACDGLWIGVDANQGYTSDTLADLLPALVEARVALLEQPFRRGREADMEGLGAPLPTAADESCQDLSELDAMVGRFNVVNIKLDKCGGLTEGLMIARRARELGLKVMVGNMMGTSLAMAPAILLGQLCDICDLDGAIFLARDREPPVSYAGGRAWTEPAAWGGGVRRTG